MTQDIRPQWHQIKRKMHEVFIYEYYSTESILSKPLTTYQMLDIDVIQFQSFN